MITLMNSNQVHSEAQIGARLEEARRRRLARATSPVRRFARRR